MTDKQIYEQNEQLTAEFLKSWNKLYPLSKDQINRGWCYQYALAQMELYPAAKLINSCGHVFIKYKGRYFDAEHPGGTKHSLSMCCCGRECKHPDTELKIGTIDYQMALEFWSEKGNSGKINWNLLKETVNNLRGAA
jgi:hypothetical protein